MAFPTSPVLNEQYISDAGIIFIWDGDKWVTTGGAGGANFAQGATGSTGPDGATGIDGPEGATGNGFTGGSYDAPSGTVTFTSDDGLGFATSDLRGSTGIEGPPGATGADSIVPGPPGATGPVRDISTLPTLS